MKATIRVSFVFALAVLAWPALRAQEAAIETWEQYQGPAAEEFLLKARVRSIKDLGTGVTFPRKAELELDGVRRSAVFKTIDERKAGVTQLSGSAEINFQDSWQTEVAAYIVDRIIGLKMVPATVERYLNGQTGSLQWWVQSMATEEQRRKQNLVPPDSQAWIRVQLKMHLFDQLIANVDRHLNNILVTKEFDLRLIDHSRSFRGQKTLKNPAILTRFSRSVIEGMEKLEYQDLRKRVGRYLMDDQIRALLARRDALLALVKEQVALRGEAAVIYP